jgi:hypothetical protein
MVTDYPYFFGSAEMPRKCDKDTEYDIYVDDSALVTALERVVVEGGLDLFPHGFE